jgi:hypothetical protein
MITWTLVIILGVMLAMVLKKLFGMKDPPPKPVEDLSSLKITNARVGDAVSISGAGDEFGDLDFTIDRHNQYTAGEKQWIELGGMYRNRRVYLEVMEEEEIEVTAVRNPNQLTLEDLGLGEQDLADIDERQNTSDNFIYEDKMWYYRFSKEVHLLRDGQARSTGYYLWEFREDGGKRLLTVRKGEGEPFTASIGTVVNPGDITVYRPT